MMSEKDYGEFLKKLRGLMVGKVVVGIEKGEGDETVCSFTVDHGTKKLKFDLGATDLGCWVGPVKVVADSGDVYTDFEALVQEVVDYISKMGFWEGDVVVPIEDPYRRLLGFKCTRTGKEWRATLVAVKASRWAKEMSTPEGRVGVAEKMMNGMPKPDAETP